MSGLRGLTLPSYGIDACRSNSGWFGFEPILAFKSLLLLRSKPIQLQESDWSGPSMSLRGKIRIIVMVAALGLLALAGLWLSSERTGLLDERKQSTLNLVSIPYSVLVQQHQLEVEGKLTRAEAQQGAIEIIRGMRYDGDNYFWINDMHPTMVMHPMKPALNGKDVSDVKDPTGKAIFVEFAKAARGTSGAFVLYQWPKPGSEKPVQKLSYVKQFEPWGWVVGTGVYVQDINAAWMAKGKMAVGLGLICLVALFLVSNRVSQSIARRLCEVIGRMQDMAQGEGDLTQRISVDSNDEISELGRGFNTFMDKLEALMARVAENTNRLATLSQEVSTASRTQAKGVEAQRDQTNQVASAMQEMSITVQQISEHSNAAATASHNAVKAARQGGSVVEKTLTGMRAISGSVGTAAEKVQGLGRKTEQIGVISGVINEIADQTNLLALNAAIEAARAGESGRGFGVVAGEVRNLAERSSAAAKQITEMIREIQSETIEVVSSIQAGTKHAEDGVESTNQAGRSLEEIIRTSDDAGHMVSQIATAATQQAATTEEINRNIDTIARIFSESTETALQSSSAIDEISTLASDLRGLVAQFKVDQEAAERHGQQLDSAHGKPEFSRCNNKAA